MTEEEEEVEAEEEAEVEEEKNETVYTDIEHAINYSYYVFM